MNTAYIGYVRRVIQTYCSDERANMAVIFAISLLPVVSAVGASVDFSHANSVKSGLQAAVDSTALMLAKDTSLTSGPQYEQMASTYFNALFTHKEVQNPQLSVSYGTADNPTVIITASADMQTDFMGIMGIPKMKVAARTSAVVVKGGEGCVLSLNKAASSATTAQGSTNVTLNGCSMYDNSQDPAAFAVGGSARITALSVSVVGGVTGGEGITAPQGVRTGQSRVEDPYATRQIRSFSGCKDRNFTAKSTQTIGPGVYCGGIGVNAGAVLTLDPGVYYLDQGDLTVNGGATLTGTGVTLVFTSSSGNKYATASINGNATINLTAPTSGDMAGVVVFGDRRIPVGTSFKFNGGSTQYFGGAVYVPTGAVSFAGGAGSSTDCTQLIADTISFDGNSGLSVNCKNSGTKSFSSQGARLTM